jgi:hypothetical protein
MIGPARLRQAPAGLCVVIPAQFGWYKFLYAPLVAVLVFWYVQQTRENSAAVLLIVAALILFSFRKWWRDVLGQQEVTVNQVAITVRSNGFIGKGRTYFVNRISNLRFVRVVTSGDREAGIENRPSVGYLTFYYESSAHKLAGRFTESEARELITLLELFTAASLTKIQSTPDRRLPPGMIAEEVHRGKGGLILYGWLGGAIYAMCLPIDDIPAVRIVSGLLALLASPSGSWPSAAIATALPHVASKYQPWVSVYVSFPSTRSSTTNLRNGRLGTAGISAFLAVAVLSFGVDRALALRLSMDRFTSDTSSRKNSQARLTA